MQSRERSLEGFKESSGPGQGLLSCIAKEILFNMVKIKQMKEGRANCVDIREGNVPAGRKRLLCKGPEATAWLVCRRDSKVWLEQMEQRGEQ